MVFDKTTKVWQHSCVGIRVVYDMCCLPMLPKNGRVLLRAACSE